MSIDYSQIYRTIVNAADPVAALAAFVAQERENAAYEVQKRANNIIDDIAHGYPCWGPNSDGDMMVDTRLDDLLADFNAIRQTLYGSPPQAAARPSRRRS